MGLALWLLVSLTHGLIDSPSILSQALGLFVCVVGAIATYLGLCRAFRVEELAFVKGLIRR
jgi:hypothetical protein